VTTTEPPGLLASPGFRSGRIRPVNYTPVNGDWCVVVGSDQPGVFAPIELAETAGWTQRVDFSSMTMLSFAVAMRQTEGVRAAYMRGLGANYPTAFVGGETLGLQIDSGPTQVITFQVGDQSLAQVIARINATLTGATAAEDNNQLGILSASLGASSKVDGVSGTAQAALGLSPPPASVTGQRVTFALRVYIGSDLVYELAPAVGEFVQYKKRSVIVDEYTGSENITFQVEAIE